MIHIKNKLSIQKMAQAGSLLSDIFSAVEQLIKPGVSTARLMPGLNLSCKKKD